MSAIYMAEPDIEIILKLIHAKATKSGFGLIFTELKKSLTYFYVSDQTFFQFFFKIPTFRKSIFFYLLMSVTEYTSRTYS